MRTYVYYIAKFDSIHIGGSRSDSAFMKRFNKACGNTITFLGVL